MKIYNFLEYKKLFVILELINKYIDNINLCLKFIRKL